MTFRQKATAIAMSALLGAASIGGALAQGGSAGDGAGAGAGTGASAGGASGTGAGNAGGGQGASAADNGGGNTNRLTGPGMNAQQPMNHPSTHSSTYPAMRPWDRTYRYGQGMADDTSRAFGDETTVAPSAEPPGGTNDAGHSVGESIAVPPAGSASQLMHQDAPASGVLR